MAGPRLRWPIRRLGLRQRIVLAFGLLSSLIAAAFALAAWLLVSTFLVGQRTRSAMRTALVHATSVDSGLAQPRPDVPAVLDSLALPSTTRTLVRHDNQWYGGLPASGEPQLPDELIALVASGTTATQRIGQGGDLVLAIGVPLPRSGGSFFEVVRLDELTSTLELFSIWLVVAVLVLGLVNTAVGWFASRVALRPLTRLTEVAAAVAAGRLETRMEDEDDPDLRELARSFNRTVEALERRVAADARFAGDVSHELRTPLTTMVNSMAVVQNRRDALPPAVLEPLDLLADDLDRFRGLVVDLIEISRDDGGEVTHLEQVEVGDLVRRAADAAARRPVTTVASDLVGVTMAADKRRLERVVTNLVENAERHGTGCMAVRVGREGDHVSIAVEDQGPGVPPERRERIFERFARAGGLRDDGGVGLGLAIVARHVRAHGGTVQVQDRAGGGARFLVSLPLRRTEDR